jgi:hypothetical protein
MCLVVVESSGCLSSENTSAGQSKGIFSKIAGGYLLVDGPVTGILPN